MLEPVNRVQLITLHTRIILYLATHPSMSQEKLARQLDVTMRTVQRHLTELESEGFISVDRDRRPFMYSIDWTRAWPEISWLRLVVFHPEVTTALQGLSDLSHRAFESASQSDVDTSQALRTLFETSPSAAPVSSNT